MNIDDAISRLDKVMYVGNLAKDESFLLNLDPLFFYSKKKSTYSPRLFKNYTFILHDEVYDVINELQKCAYVAICDKPSKNSNSDIYKQTIDTVFNTITTERFIKNMNLYISTLHEFIDNYVSSKDYAHNRSYHKFDNIVDNYLEIIMFKKDFNDIFKAITKKSGSKLYSSISFKNIFKGFNPIKQKV